MPRGFPSHPSPAGCSSCALEGIAQGEEKPQLPPALAPETENSLGAAQNTKCSYLLQRSCDSPSLPSAYLHAGEGKLSSHLHELELSVSPKV